MPTREAKMRALFMCIEKKLHQIAASPGITRITWAFSPQANLYSGPGEPRSRIVRVIAGAKYDYDAAVQDPDISLISSLPRRRA